MPDRLKQMKSKKKKFKSLVQKHLTANDLDSLQLQVAQPRIVDNLVDDLADNFEAVKSAQQKALFSVIVKIRESLELDGILKSTATEVRQLLKADRVGMYRFHEDAQMNSSNITSEIRQILDVDRVGMYRFDKNSDYASGEMVSEDVLPQYNSALAQAINDCCFGKNYNEYYQNRRIWACNDIYQNGLSDCHIQLLERFQIKANLVVPLFKGDRLWGLLCIHQCSAPRQWLDSEIDFVKQVATHLDIALQQAEFVDKLRSQSDSLIRAVEQAVEREKAVAAIINKIRRSLDLDTIFTTTTAEVRQLLQADRVTIYRFNPDWSGEFVVESMAEGLNSLVQDQVKYPELNFNISECSLKSLANPAIADTYLQETDGGDFNNGQLFRVRDDIYATDFSECYIKALEQYQARAYAIIAIYKGKALWGLLAAYQSKDVRHWQESEVNFLVQIGAQLGVAIQQAELFGQVQKHSSELQTTLEVELQKRADRLARDAEQERALARVIERIRQTLDIDTIFSATTQEVRQNLNCDRVVVYRFFEDWSGEFVFESKTDDWRPIVDPSEAENISRDIHLQDTQGGRYRNHESFTVNDVYTANLTDCHLEILEYYQIRAFMIAPVFVGDKLWGLLAAYQHSDKREWESSELSLLNQVGNQLGVAVQQAELLVQLKKAKENADTANSAKGDFLAHMSHELRTPLNSILGFTQVLARDPSLNPTQREHLEIIARSGEHLLTLLNDVLEMSKIEAGLIELNTNGFDLYNLLDNLKEMFLLKTKAKNLQLVFDFAADVPRYIQTDESKLRQVLINLIGNAVKFTSQGQVILQVRSSNGLAEDDLEGSNIFLYFQVFDTGPGIAPQELDNLFEAFVQTETGRKSQEGTGLGMPISKRFVQLMGGDIHVESTLNKGTIVNFQIQIQIAQASDVPAPQVKRRAIALAPNQPQYRILLADDKWESRHLMKNILLPLGFEIHEAENGLEAVEVWRSWQPDFIWMDMQMPVMDGYEATRTIRAEESPEYICKIVALTASVFDKQRSVVLELGCDDFVSKPLREEIIFDKIAEHLDVTYIYADRDRPEPVSEQEVGDRALISTELDNLEPEWLLNLNLAVRGADEEAIFRLLTQIQPTHPTIANGIQDLVHNFQLEQILRLIQPSIDNSSNGN
jgi:GAF domain-containing protein/CheY-like chemotaxis protein